MNAHGLPAPWPSVLAAIEAGSRLADTRYYDLKARYERQAEDIAALQTENAELRDGMTALSNRIEGVSRTLASRTEHLA